jgi:DNA mismatch repair ATPase MutS
LALKLTLFAGSLLTGYYAFNGLPYIFPISCFAVYLYMLFLDSRMAETALEIKELIKSYSTELKYIQGDLSGLENGIEFLSTEHNYAADLDIFGENSLFQEINRTVTPNGAKILCSYLKNPCLEDRAILSRQAAIQELSEHNSWSHEFRVKGKIHPVSSYDESIIDKWKNINYFLNGKFKTALFISNGLCFASLLIAVSGLIPYNLFITLASLQLAIFAITMGLVNKAHFQLDKVIKSITNYFYLINHVNKIDFKSAELAELKAKLNNSLTAFKELKSIQNSFDQRSNILTTIIFNALYLRDIHTLSSVISWRNKYVDNINEWTNVIDKFDALISMANYKFNHPDYIFPEITSKCILAAKGVVHPLMKGEDVVDNDFYIDNLHEMYIVTGANMSGKSTFLRSVGLNLVLALSGNVTRCKEFAFTPVNLFTSMRTTDNLSMGRSYFHAELLRLKTLHDIAGNGQAVFVILDEMLKGTNSEDKLNGSLKFLVKLLQFNISGIIATHDLAIGQLSDTYPRNFHNICFEIDHSDDDIIYTYKLQNGISKNMNASFLLKKMNLI